MWKLPRNYGPYYLRTYYLHIALRPFPNEGVHCCKLVENLHLRQHMGNSHTQNTNHCSACITRSFTCHIWLRKCQHYGLPRNGLAPRALRCVKPQLLNILNLKSPPFQAEELSCFWGAVWIHCETWQQCLWWWKKVRLFPPPAQKKPGSSLLVCILHYYYYNPLSTQWS